MKLRPFSAGLLGAMVALAGPAHLPLGGLPVMVDKANADQSGQAGGVPSMPLARDPSATVVREYEVARQAGTREAFELFLARHGDDPLAEQARADLKRLAR